MNKKKRIRYAVFIFVCFLVLIFYVASIVVTQNLFLYNTINSVLGGESRVLVSGDPSLPEFQYYTADEGINSKADALAAANAVNERIVEEGIVMLKNDQSLPLKKNSKISVFGKNSVNLVYGGSGSAGASTDGAVTIGQSLTTAGFQVNPTLINFYNDDTLSGDRRPKTGPAMGSKPAGLPTYETPVSRYTDEVKKSFSEYNDAAIVVISRIGGEGFDLPRTMKESYDEGAAKIEGARSADDHYLQLDQNETDLIKAVGEQFGFDNVIVVINSGAPIELGFLDDPSHYAYSPNVKGALWIGTTGKTGINALGRILNGEVNPSGRTVDTYARDFKNDPSWNNFANNNVNNGNRYTVDGKNKSYYFVDYEEGIYVGYRYWETRGYTEEQAGNPDWYEQNVVYPIGYGLSYTHFAWEIDTQNTTEEGQELLKDGTVNISVKVTNTGEVAGKDVVQLYLTAPYTGTAQNPGIEKSHVVMLDFGKTRLLQPGESDEIKFSVDVHDFASYDYNDANGNGFKGYEVEDGDYILRISKNAHESVIDLDYTVPVGGYTYATDPVTDKPVENRFDEVSEHITTYLSRTDWEGTWPSVPTEQDKAVTDEFIDSLTYDRVDEGKPWYTEEMPTQSGIELTYSQTKVKLYELMDKDYDDPLWDELLDQLTVAQMAKMIGTGNYNTMNIDGIDKPKTIDPDGPVGFTAFMGDPSVYDTCYYASGCVVAATYNTELAYEMGKAVGNEGIIGNEAGDGTPYSGWYAPAVNIHRSQFGGRNWEYYSEDGVLSGKIAAGVIQGAMDKGVYTYVKHFALNDQETDRTNNGYLTWANEQSMREIYLRPFEIAVKEGGTTAMMSSFNRIGTEWAGGSYDLLTEILRNEWGFRGMVVTDYNLYAHMPADQMIRAGGDLNLCQDKQPSTTQTATHVTALRNAAKNILYTVVNSNAMNGHGAGIEYRYIMPVWEMCLIGADVAVAVGMIIWIAFIIRGRLKRKKLASEVLTGGEGAVGEDIGVENAVGEGATDSQGADANQTKDDGNENTRPSQDT